MGESPVDAPVADNTMGDSGATGVAALQVSVSFGRFENDLLSWEKWSAFPTNKYLEEVEKCSTPGSVAQKKAYFEAHYKKIAARKAEQEDQDKKRGAEPRDPVDSEDKIQRDLVSGFDAVQQNSVSGIELENEAANSASGMSSNQGNEPKDCVDMVNESDGSAQLMDGVKDESCCTISSLELQKSEGAALVKEEAPLGSSQREEELIQHIDNDKDEVSTEKEEKVKSEKSLKPQKASTGKKANNTTVLKKKPSTTTPKSSLLSTPKVSRPVLSKSTISETGALSKKEHETSPLINKKPTRVETRRAAPSSLHMSISLGPSNSQLAPSTTMRKSLIMEKMGDKDIVKRAFKAFRSNFNQLSSSSPGKPTLVSQIPGKETGIKTSVVGTPQKKIEGVSKMVKKSPQSSQPRLRKTSNPHRLHNAVGADQMKDQSLSLSHNVRSHDKPDKRKELSKKPEEKANGKAAERNQLQSKVKKETEMKRVPHNHNTKGKPISATVTPKRSLDKKGGKHSGL